MGRRGKSVDVFGGDEAEGLSFALLEDAPIVAVRGLLDSSKALLDLMNGREALWIRGLYVP